MLQSISWGQFIIALMLVLIVYYTYLAVRYAGDLKKFKVVKKPTVLQEQEKFEDDPEEPEPVSEQTETVSNDQEEFFDRIEKMVGELKTRISGAAKENLVKGALATELRTIIRTYPGLEETSYRNAINELINDECEQHGLTPLSDEELEGLWQVIR